MKAPAVPVPSGTLTPITVIKNTVIEGKLTAEDVHIMTYRYNVLNMCGIAAARMAIESHDRGDGTYRFTLYELMIYLGPSLPIDPDDLNDSVLNAGLVVQPDAFDLMSLTGDVPAIDA